MSDFERMGVFYLGKGYDLATGKTTDAYQLYESKNLTTHAVILGMTGSGKTGLGISLLEEAAIDGVPTIAIDPKGDLGNLLLAFPELRPEDFRPWIDEAEAARRGQTPDAFAAETATRWREGLAAWGQDAQRVARFHDAVDANIYTPGSNAGRPLAILKSFAAPPAALRDDPEAMRGRVAAAAGGLLTLLGLDADPVRSREYVLLATILDTAWRQGRDLDLVGLVREIQKPPFTTVGVLDLESFFPAKERFGLALAINAFVASPGFSAWAEGEPLDVQRLLWTPEGKPRLSVISIAHLSDAERMFFVTRLLDEVVGWTRAQSGTSSLRAILYMDEVFGYLPPSANPPSKLPLLTLLKQARAFGLGVVLATQNPVDLDYKALGNAGSWFLGRLQTERDKLRVLDGLEGAAAAAASYDRAKLESTLAALRPRVFLAYSANEDVPALFQTRWALSYLRGPLTRPQIQTLMSARAQAPDAPGPVPYARAAGATSAGVAPAPSPASGGAPAGGVRPVLPPDVPEFFFPARAPDPRARLEYRPSILGSAKLHYVDARAGVDAWEALAAVTDFPDELALEPWDGAKVLEGGKMPALDRQPAAAASFARLPAPASRAKNYAAWQRALEEWLFRTRALEGWAFPELKLTSKPGESEGDFRVRVGQALRERRDEEVAALQQKFRPKLLALDDKMRAADARVQREKSQSTQAKMSTGISFGAAILGALFGGRKLGSAGNVGRAASAARGFGRASQQAEDVDRAEEGREVLAQRKGALEQEIQAEIQRLQSSADPVRLELVPVRIAPRKSDLTAGSVSLVWTPYAVEPDGSSQPLA